MLSKKLKVLLFALGGSLLMTGCGNKPAPAPAPIDDDDVDPCPPGEHKDEDRDGFCDICHYPVEVQHAVSVSGTPSKPFMLMIGEEKTLTVSLSPTPSYDDEKLFTWKNNTPTLVEMTTTEKTNEVVIKGLKAGEAKITATNTYNLNLEKEFRINIIDINEDDSYLWQLEDWDVKKFGTDEVEGGYKEGSVSLGGILWDYNRSNNVGVRNGNGSIQFGKSAQPETDVKFVTKNHRKVTSIGLETSSAHGLAKCIIKVGDTEVINKQTETYSLEETVTFMSSGDLENLEGDISIEFITPEYDAEKASIDETYIAPGAFYLKSILITYAPEEIEYKTKATYDLAAMYNDPNDTTFKNLTGSAKEIILEDENFVITFKDVRKQDDAIGAFARTNNDIFIKSKKTDEEIKRVVFKVAIRTSGASNAYDLVTSVLGGEPYTDYVGESSKTKLDQRLYSGHINALALYSTSTTYIGLKSLTIQTVSGSHAVVDSIAFEGSGASLKKDYETGDIFDPTGLGEATVKFTDSEISSVKIPASSLTFYDGPSYDTPADHSGATVNLQTGTTEVVGVYKGHEVRISDITVTAYLYRYDRVKDIADLTDGEYLFVIPSSSQYWKGSMSNSDMKLGKSFAPLSVAAFTDSIELIKPFKSETLLLSVTDGAITITNQSGGKIGITDNNTISIAKTPAISLWSATVNEGFVNFSITGSGDTTKYLTFGGTKIDVSDSANNSIALYKYIGLVE